MSRLQIELSPEQHQRLKATAALKGQTIKQYVLERVLPPSPDSDLLSDDEALNELAEFLKPRIEAAERGEISNRTIEDIKRDARLSLED